MKSTSSLISLDLQPDLTGELYRLAWRWAQCFWSLRQRGDQGTACAGSAVRTTGCALALSPGVEEFKEVIVLRGMKSGMWNVCALLLACFTIMLQSRVGADAFEDKARSVWSRLKCLCSAAPPLTWDFCKLRWSHRRTAHLNQHPSQKQKHDSQK